MGDRSWLHEQPEPIVQHAMRDEGRYERRRALATGDAERHPLDCRCGRSDCDERPSRSELR